MLRALTRRVGLHWISSRQSAVRGSIPFPRCSMCVKPVPLETCKTDEAGKAVHEECYVLKVKLIAPPVQPIWWGETPKKTNGCNGTIGHPTD